MVKQCPKSCVVVVVVAVVLALLSVGEALAQEDSPWLVRVRVLSVMPDDDSTAITTIGGNAKVDDNVTIDLDISYFFTANLALELILGVSQHDVEAVNTSVGTVDLGDVTLLPPTLTLQYHIMPEATCRPYVGLGINATHFFDEDAGGADGISYDDNLGIALQAGLDYGVTEDWALNVDVKKVYLDTDVDVQALGTTVSTTVDIDPWIIGIGVARRF